MQVGKAIYAKIILQHFFIVDYLEINLMFIKTGLAEYNGM